MIAAATATASTEYSPSCTLRLTEESIASFRVSVGRSHRSIERASIGAARCSYPRAVAPSPPRAVVFDCDGLLLDTEECWTRAERELFRRHGRVFTAEHKRRMLGKAGDATAAILVDELDRPGHGHELRIELLELARDEVAAGATARPGAIELVAELRGRVALGLASNSPRAIVSLALAGAGLTDAFDVVLSGDDVADPKPAPEIYVTACRRLGVAVSEAVALEDSPTGVAAAVAAGLYVIGIPSLAGIVLDAPLTAAALDDAAVRAALGLGERRAARAPG